MSKFGWLWRYTAFSGLSTIAMSLYLFAVGAWQVAVALTTCGVGGILLGFRDRNRPRRR
jgi:hypothetical protein